MVTGPSPAELAERADSLSLAFLVLLESLSPHQRAAFLLREVFDYPYPEVAEIIGTDVDSTRHLVARARSQVQEGRPRYHATRRQREELAQRFFAASEQGDLSALEELLAQDVALHADGGGNVQALAQPSTAASAWHARCWPGWPGSHALGVRLRFTEVNGQPGAMAYDAEDQLAGVMGLGHRRRRHGPVHPLHRQPRQAAPPRRGQRPRRSASRRTPSPPEALAGL